MPVKAVKGKILGKIEPAKEGNGRDYIFETMINKNINKPTPCNHVNVSGFRKFSLLGRFEGTPNATISFEVYQNNISIAQETFDINKDGWYTFTKVYDVFAPDITAAIYLLPPNLKAQISLYAGY